MRNNPSQSKFREKSKLYLTKLRKKLTYHKFRPQVFLRKYLKTLKILFILLCSYIVVYSGSTYLKKTDYFKIKTYTHTGIVKYVNENDFKSVVESNINGKNIIFFNTSALSKTLLNSFFGAKKVEVKKKFPDKLIINVQERVPITIVKDYNGQSFLSDIDGHILGEVEPGFFDLPQIYFDGIVYIGQTLDSRIAAKAVEIITESKIEKVQLSSLSFKPDYSYFYLDQGTIVYVGNEKNIKRMLKVVSSLQFDAQEKGQKMLKIDLRYDKVIVLYE